MSSTTSVWVVVNTALPPEKQAKAAALWMFEPATSAAGAWHRFLRFWRRDKDREHREFWYERGYRARRFTVTLTGPHPHR